MDLSNKGQIKGKQRSSKMGLTWVGKEELHKTAILHLERVDIILDIGCGIRPQTFLAPKVHICCEPFGQYIDHLQEKIKNETDRHYVVLKASWAEAVEMFPPKSVDTVFLNYVIEHLEKEEAARLLKRTETIARRQVVVITPLGFLPQEHSDGKDAWGLEGGPWQEHKSGWRPEDFDNSWDLLASEGFHENDNLGNKLKKAHGAFWAIKSLNRTLFSVLVPIYNHASFLPEALNSLLAQTYPHWEALLVDDGSTDSTAEVMKAYAARDHRFRTFHKENGGTASALNEGLKNSRGEWICWLSSDDLFESDKLNVHRQAILNNPGIKFFHSGYSLLDDHTKTKTLPTIPPLPAPAFQSLRFFSDCWVHGNTIAIHRSLFEEYGGFKEDLRNGQDFEMWLRLSTKIPFQFINRRTCITRIHPGQGTSQFFEAGVLDCARACWDFLNSHHFSEIFPFLNLKDGREAALAILETLKSYLNPRAFIHAGGWNRAMLERMREWLHGECPEEIQGDLWKILRDGVQRVLAHSIPEEVKGIFQDFIRPLKTSVYTYAPHDFIAELKLHAGRLKDKGETKKAEEIYLYLSKNIYGVQGEVALRRGESDRAKELFEQSLSFDPRNEISQRRLSEIGRRESEGKRKEVRRAGSEKRRILLISPPYARFLGLENCRFPLSFGNMASILAVNHHEVAIYDADFDRAHIGKQGSYEYNFLNQPRIPEALQKRDHYVWKEVEQTVRSFSPEIVGLTVMTNKYPMAEKIAGIIKSVDPAIRVVIGGHHPTIFGEKLLRDENVDFAVAGEGEITLLELINRLCEPHPDFSKVEGLIFKEKGNICTNPPRALLDDLDILPLADRSLILNEAYVSENNIITGRGCPFRCSYCGAQVIWKNRVRRRSVANVIEEVRYLIRRSGSRQISFWDDSFTCDRAYTVELLEALRKPSDITFSCITRLDLVDQEILKKMKEAGCNQILFGIESGNDLVLKRMNKKMSRDFIKKKTDLVRSAGIPWLGFFIMGYPGETREDILETLAFMKELSPGYAEINIFNPLPGTGIWKDLESRSLVGSGMDFSRHSQASLENHFVSGVARDEFRTLALHMAKEFDLYNRRRRDEYRTSL